VVLLVEGAVLGGRVGFHVGRWGRLLRGGMGVVLEGVVGKVVLEGPVTVELEGIVDFHVVRQS
jgi:hypothetical protein